MIPICVAGPEPGDIGEVVQNGGYARASYASGGGGASRVPRIAGDVTAGPWPCQLRAGERCAVRGKGAAFDLLRRG